MMKTPVYIPNAVLAEIVERLAEVAGMAPGLLDAGRLRGTLESRRRNLCLRDFGEYVEYLKSSGEELEHLIDATVIRETRFFRDHAIFEQIETWARKAWLHRPRPLRILSAPCSSGQEAYSVAAILLQAGVPLDGFIIDAMDISRTALDTAQHGVYPARALEHVPDELRSRCAQRRDDGWAIRDDVRSRIRFEQRNIVVPGALGEEAVYDLILCRNVFIYLHSKARAILAESLRRALRDGGRLILGAGDRVPELNNLFTPLKPAAGFAFIHRPPASPSSRNEARIVREVTTGKSYLRDRLPRVEQEQHSTSATEYYQRAVEYSRCGNLRQAERRCRQALYLDPCHVPALELLYTIWRVHPSARLCDALEARIRRVRSGESNVVAGARARA
jgi:chemotaxis methyl-accepting protein methylase